MIGEAMDPIPFLLGAYGCASFLLLTYAGWQLRLRSRLRQLYTAAQEVRTHN
ncbi:MAG: hypothetical protein NTX25_09145 [Proteobacteria bacterium]|nr:hypothetical protein [Pseudomonadota bacterium]